MEKFIGTGVAMVTPFSEDGSIDFNGLENLINHIIEGGVEYLVSLGTTGETATLSKDEKQRVWEFTAEKVNKRVPLVAGIGGNNTQDIIQTLKSFNSADFDGVLSVSPYYNKPTQEGIYQHYKAISEHCPLPIILYNVPGRTGSNVLPDTILRLASDFENIIAVKEASASFEQFNIIARDKPDGFLFISGDDPITLPMIAMGAAGVISVVGNAIPKPFSSMVRMCLSGNFTEALPLHFSMLQFTSHLFAEGNPAGVKAALAELGICLAHVRLPLVPASGGLKDKIRQELEKLA